MCTWHQTRPVYEVAQKLLKLATSDQNVRAYLSAQLPVAVEKNPYDSPVAWTNETKLAGQLKITEAMPALGKWVGINDIDKIEFTDSMIMRLDTDPAAKALSQIGDPAVPTLVQVFSSDKWNSRRDAILALRLIASPAADNALSEQANRETDPELKRLIARILELKRTNHQSVETK